MNSELLKTVDKDLIEMEETLLNELDRLRKLDSSEDYSEIEAASKTQFKQVYSRLLAALENSGDWSNLSLKTQEHEVIEDRMRVVRNILVRKLPTAFLAASHLENKMVTSGQSDTDKHFASKELAIFNEQVSMHHVDGRTIKDVLKERAQFDSKDLSQGYEQEKTGSKRAQSADDIRKKLEGVKGGGGPSIFGSRELSGSAPPIPSKPVFQAAKSGLAQKPQDIKREVAERQTEKTGGAGKAIFGATDIENVSDKPLNKKPEEPVKKTPSAPAAGKAVFGSKDIEPVRAAEPKKTQELVDEKPESAAGKASFLSKDLSDPEF
jgi:hypothetical protein